MGAVASVTGRFDSNLRHQHPHYRQIVFLERSGWDAEANAAVSPGVSDQAHALYIVARDSDGDTLGSARLLPAWLSTAEACLFRDSWLSLLAAGQVLDVADVWVLSDFAALDLKAVSHTANDPPVVQATLRMAGGKDEASWVGSVPVAPAATIAAKLLREVCAAAKKRGAVALVTALSPGMQSLFVESGFQPLPVGVTQRVNTVNTVDDPVLRPYWVSLVAQTRSSSLAWQSSRG